MSNNAIDTAARFGDIPFSEFTAELIDGTFNALVKQHIIQMEEYSAFVSSLTEDLSTYINNTKDGVSFEEITDFVMKYDLPTIDDSTLETVLGKLESPKPAEAAEEAGEGSETTWLGALTKTVTPVVEKLIDQIGGDSPDPALEAITKYNEEISGTLPDYEQITSAMAMLISSNKYGLLQNLAKQGMMRLIVTEGEIETKITFSTWNNSTSGSSTSDKERVKNKIKNVKGGGFLGIFKNKDKTKNRTVTVNTAKSYQRDSSGTKVDIFGRVLIKFKTDYAPLNG
ncbi:hypothetical protein [Marinoscillum pacificum]|uniref:hypothetical protein n=1 Tax=Marinoscillum pacificum TaxID=392723 RepID=UPI0021573AAE|nr:hypothetical protein [Marinoscillum pacificum]